VGLKRTFTLKAGDFPLRAAIAPLWD